MEKHTNYKDTGIEWLGEIPEHWQLDRIKNIASVKARVGWKALKASEYLKSGYFFLSTPNIKNAKIDYENVNYITKERYIESPEIMLKNEDILLVKDGSTLGIVNIVKNLKKKGTVNSSIAVLRLRKQNSKYFFYFLKSNYLQNIIGLKKEGMGVPHLFQKDINNFLLSIPPLEEQTQIANYLDAKTAVIDKKIKILQQKTKQYKAYRKTVINETVTKGLDKTVSLKDSGINWIGEIPEHWEVKRLKDISKIFTGNSISDKSLFEVKKDTYSYIATKDINIHNKEVTYNNGVYIPKSDKSFKITKKDTSLICLEGASAGKKLTFVDREVAFVNKLCAIKCFDKKVFDKYIFYFLQTNLFNSQFFELLSGVIGGVSLGLLKYFNILAPTKKEQQEIAGYLDARTATIDSTLKNIETQITTLKELRKTLINEVVTGKVKVME